MENNCLNCGRPITDNFCSNCGQKKYKRIDKKYLVDEIQYSLIHTNKGFFYSVKNILLNPGKTAKDFIDGNRVNHYKPILLAFVLSGISAYISYKVIGMNEIMEEHYTKEKIPKTFIHNYMTIISSYSSFMMLLLIPIVSLFTKLMFRKWGQNYYEHVIMNAYIQSCFTLFSIILLYPILYVLRSDGHNFILATMCAMVLFPLLMIWFYKGFYKEKSIITIALRVLLFTIIVCITFIILMFIGFVIFFALNPEMIKEFQPPK